MATIKKEEDYVSFETAKLLKEKGFDVNTINFWHIVPSETCDFNALEKIACGDVNEPEYSENYYPMITLQMTMKWLREVHNLQIQIAPITSKHKDWTFGIYKEFNPLTIDLLCFPTYEEAVEVAIKYCLDNLI